MYTYNRVTYEILDYADYYLDITDIQGGWKPLFASESSVIEYQFPANLGKIAFEHLINATN